MDRMSDVLRLTGKIDVPPQNIVSVSVPLGGYLLRTRLLPGMHVAQGEIIAVMEDQQYIQLQQDYLTAKARIAFLESDVQRQRELNKEQAASDKVLQQVQADYAAQKILLAALAQKLLIIGIQPARLTEASISRTINIYSPIKGYVSKVNVNIGKYVSPTDVLFELIDPTDIHLALKVFEKDVPHLFVGQKITAYTNHEPDRKHPCEVLLIGKDVADDRSVQVHCHFETYDPALLPGTYMNAEAQLTNGTAIAVPDDAVVRYSGKTYVVAAVGNNRYRMVPVTTGSSNGGYTAIQPAGEPLPTNMVLTGAYNVLMALKNIPETE
ncbi:MAG: efflux RND transporter periplasmic adaptor subunit [Chitinophagia bacterium]|nr:efflux RND transporter periplasmic adaptor subunit [Chitinophagia bacterium]